MNLFSTYPDDYILVKWQELGHQVSLIREIAEKVFGELGTSVSFKVGTMIEIPRAALVADEVSLIFQHYDMYIYLYIVSPFQILITILLWETNIISITMDGCQVAEHAEFFSFGTNDLTQMTFGYSRDDVGKFLPIYLSKGILQSDPFEVSPYSNPNEPIQSNYIHLASSIPSPAP